MTATAPAAPRVLTLLLPPRERLRRGDVLPDRLGRVLGRGDVLEAGKPGREAQLLRHFDVLPRRVPIAPLTRQLDAGDGAYGAWLRADPAHVRADLGRARMLACGELGLDAAEAEALVAALRPLFGDEGFPISAPTPSRWYLMIPTETRLPEFALPEDVLGDDLHAHMPEGDPGRRWRRLLNEAQVVLHNHPVNARRAAAGKLPVNSLWFFGGGAMPDHVRCGLRGLASEDPLVAGLAARVQPPTALTSPAAAALSEVELVDLPDLRDVAELESPWLAAAFEALAAGRFEALDLDFADGRRQRWLPAHRWRFWRRAARALE